MYCGINKSTKQFTGAVYSQINDDLTAWGKTNNVFFIEYDGDIFKDDELITLTDEEFDAIYFKFSKSEKLKEINRAKKVYQDKPVLSQISGVDYHFFGGLESARKYKDALDLALSLGLTTGKIKVAEGLVEIAKSDMDVALTAISLQVYKGWLKESYYIEAINNATTVAELDAIVWEDVYTGGAT